MTRLVGPDAGASLPCGCRVEVRDDGFHIWPCSPAHQAAHDQAIAEVLAPEGVAVEYEE